MGFPRASSLDYVSSALWAFVPEAAAAAPITPIANRAMPFSRCFSIGMDDLKLALGRTSNFAFKISDRGFKGTVMVFFEVFDRICYGLVGIDSAPFVFDPLGRNRSGVR